MKRLLALLVLAFLAPISSGQTVSVTHDPWTGDAGIHWEEEIALVWFQVDIVSSHDTRAEDVRYLHDFRKHLHRWGLGQTFAGDGPHPYVYVPMLGGPLDDLDMRIRAHWWSKGSTPETPEPHHIRTSAFPEESPDELAARVTGTIDVYPPVPWAE